MAGMSSSPFFIIIISRRPLRPPRSPSSVLPIKLPGPAIDCYRPSSHPTETWNLKALSRARTRTDARLRAPPCTHMAGEHTSSSIAPSRRGTPPPPPRRPRRPGASGRRCMMYAGCVITRLQRHAAAPSHRFRGAGSGSAGAAVCVRYVRVRVRGHSNVLQCVRSIVRPLRSPHGKVFGLELGGMSHGSPREQ